MPLLWVATVALIIVHVGANIVVFSGMSRHQIVEKFDDIPARFGPQITESITGMIVYAEPSTACTEISPPPNIHNYNGGWIALIARYNCSFEIKVRMAQKSGYNATIIHNVGSDDLEPMSVKNQTGIEIPAVFVSQQTGELLKEFYNYRQRYFVVINEDIVPFNINTHLLLPFAIVVGICFLVMVIFMVVRCIKDRRRQRRHRLPKSSLKKIPMHKYTKGDPYETCAICLDDYVESEKLRILPCAHAYHSKCIDPWLTKNRRVCPVCKRKVFAEDERVITDSESDSDADDSTPLIRDGHHGTQGGTFTAQRENPFSRARRAQQRRDSNASSSSDEIFRSLISSGDSRNSQTGETSGATTFMVSDSHSINGEPTDFERSNSSTNAFTVTLCNVEAEEHPASVVHVSQNSRNISNITSAVLTTPILSSESQENDLVV